MNNQKLLSGIFILVLSVNMFAQDFYLGPKIGLTLFTEKFTHEAVKENVDNLIGYDTGLLLGLKPWNKLGVQIEPGVITKGSARQYFISSSETNIRLTYLTMPVHVNYELFNHFSVLAGPDISYLLMANAHSGDDKTDLKEFMYDKNIDIAFDFGISYFVIDRVYLGLKYNFGLLPTTEAEEIDTSGNPTGSFIKSYNRGFIFNLGVLIF